MCLYCGGRVSLTRSCNSVSNWFHLIFLSFNIVNIKLFDIDILKFEPLILI